MPNIDDVFNYVMDSPENTNPGVLRSLLNNLNSGPNLPEVTADDKNKYLHTNSSTGDLEWSAVSGGGVLVVNVTGDGDEMTCDKTAAEMLTAARSGLVIIHGVVENAEMNYPVTIANLIGETYSFSTASPAFRFEANDGDSYPISSNK